MNKNNLLTITEEENKTLSEVHKDALVLCKELGAFLDCVTSDIDLYVFAKNADDAKKIAEVYDCVPIQEKFDTGYPDLKPYNISFNPIKDPHIFKDLILDSNGIYRDSSDINNKPVKV